MLIEFVICPANKPYLKEDLNLSKLHNHHIIGLKVDDKGRFELHTVKKVLLMTIGPENDTYTIRHLDKSKFYHFNEIVNNWKNKYFIECQINAKRLNLKRDKNLNQITKFNY